MLIVVFLSLITPLIDAFLSLFRRCFLAVIRLLFPLCFLLFLIRKPSNSSGLWSST